MKEISRYYVREAIETLYVFVEGYAVTPAGFKVPIGMAAVQIFDDFIHFVEEDKTEEASRSLAMLYSMVCEVIREAQGIDFKRFGCWVFVLIERFAHKKGYKNISAESYFGKTRVRGFNSLFVANMFRQVNITD